MDFNSQISEKQLSDLCTYYEQKSKNARNLMRESLNIRQKIKAKIIEDKDRQAFLLQILERLDEYEKVVTSHLEAAEKMEDPESLIKLEIIKKYESMVREQRAVWAKYEEEYEQLPLAKERRQVQLQLLKTSIQVKLLNYKIEEKKKMINLKNQISKRREQFAIINFAKFMVDYKNREKNYYELQGKVNALKRKEQEFRLEIQQLEQLSINRDNKMNSVKIQPSMKALSLPPMDLSRFIVSQNNDNADKISIYSLNLEQEYMNNETDNVDKGLSKTSTKPTKIEESNSRNNGSQEINTDTFMDINSEEMLAEINQESVVSHGDQKSPSDIPNGESSKKNSQESVKKSGQHTSKKRASQKQVSQDCSKSENVRVEQRNSRIFTERPIPTPAKMPKHMQVHEDYNYKNTHDPMNSRGMNGHTPSSPVVATKVQDWQRASSPKTQKINRDQQRQHQSQHQVQQPKLQRQQYYQEQQQQQQQQPQQQQQQQQRQNQHHRQPLQEQQQRPPLQQQQPQQQRHHLQQEQPQQQWHHLQQEQPQQQRHHLQQEQPQQQRQPVHPQQSQQQRHLLEQQRQQKQQMSWSPNLNPNTDGQNFKEDLTGLPQSNKPHIKSNERVHFDTQRLFHKQQTSHKTIKHLAGTPMDISYDENETVDAPPQMIQQSHTFSNQNKSSRTVQSEQLVTTQYQTINADSMMSATMYASDSNVSADNISGIIGSDITEPGGVIGLVRHLHEDGDDISEDVDIDFDNIMSKFCSPLQQGNSKLPQQPVQINEEAASRDPQEHTNRNFAMVQFQQKNQSNTAQHFF